MVVRCCSATGRRQKAPGLAERAAKLEKKANKVVAFNKSEAIEDHGTANPVPNADAPIGAKSDVSEAPIQAKPKQKKTKGASGSSKKGGGFGDGERHC